MENSSGVVRTLDRLRQSLVLEWGAVTAVLAAIAFAGAIGGWFARIDHAFYDVALALYERRPSADIVIVAIDDESLERIGRWPWPRAVHAELIERLRVAGAKAIGLDLILAEPDANADPALAAALRRAGNVVLPVHAERTAAGRFREVRPVSQLQMNAAALGHIHVELDVDGVARGVFLLDGVEQPDWPHFAVALGRVASGGATTVHVPLATFARGDSLVRGDLFLIPFVGPPGSMAQVSYARVVAGDVSPERFRGKYVLVGATAVGLGDAYPTPVSAGGRPMPGIEISANVLDALESGFALRPVKPLVQALISALATVLLLASFVLLSPRRALFVTGAAIAVLIAAVLTLLRTSGIWFGPAATLAAFVLAYPLWSWRRLEAAVRHLGVELDRVAEETGLSAALIGRSATLERSKAGWGDTFARQLTAVHDAEERLRRSHRVLAQSLAGLPVAVLVADTEGRVVLSNAAAHRTFGDTVDTAVALDCLQRLDRNGARDWADLLAAATRDRQTAFRNLDTEAGMSYLTSIAPYALLNESAIGSIVTLVDVTALRRLEREQTEFMQFISHDMRSPQTSILALLELDREDPDGMPRAELNARIDAHVRRTLGMIDGILQLASAERAAPPNFTDLDLAQIAQEAVDDAWAAATTADQTIELEVPPQPAWVRGDRQLLLRAIGNLISNALKYSPPKSAVHVVVRSTGLGIVCRVTDHGQGIPPESQTRLFRKFQRIVTDPNADPGGLGLGLVIVKTVAERHGGGVRVESAQRRGSTFELWLPAPS